MKRRLTDKDKRILDEVKKNKNIPEHVAIIMDGNGRWASKKGLPRVAGHQQGVETVRLMVESCVYLGIKCLTLYTFSSENWNRPQKEVSTLMRLIVKSLQNETNELHSNNIKITTIGETNKLPELVQKELEDARKKTINNDKLVLNLALSYSGRTEMVNAVKKISEKVKNGDLDVESINEETISKSLYTSEIPDPDLLIRSGGEFRVSNFLLWQIAYSEIFVTNILWPDFGVNEFKCALQDYQSRERRFGLISEQISNNHKNTRNVEKLTKQMA